MIRGYIAELLVAGVLFALLLVAAGQVVNGWEHIAATIGNAL
jgi:hypothetical protein